MTNGNRTTCSKASGHDASCFRDRRVLVTGGDGFIGSHLAETLLEAGARVGLFVRGSARLGCGSWAFRGIEASPDRFARIIAADIASPDAENLIGEFDPEIVFHLAAVAYVDYSFDKPAEVFRTNAVGTLNVLETARRLRNLDRVVVVSSSEVYGPCLTERIAEDHPLNPTSPYAASKAAADRLAFSYYKTYGLPVAIVRPFNTYGPRHTYDAVPKFVRLALRGEPLTIYGDGAQERDLTYVRDTVRAMLLAGGRGEAVGEAVNSGTGEAVSILELARRIVRIAGSSSAIVHTKARKAEVSCLRADIGKAARLLGFHPEVSLDEGLAMTIAWERARSS